MAIARGESTTKAICDALGVDSAVTYRLLLDMSARDVNKVIVYQYLTDEQAAALGVLLKQYELTPKDDA
jgi:hypothetical protein